MKKVEPKIVEFMLKDLSPAKYNPRRISGEAMDGLTRSLERFGCVELIVVNVRTEKNVIVGGHQRYKVLLKRHKKNYKCDCIAVNLSDTDEKLLNVTLNNPAIQGEFIKEIENYITQLQSEIPEVDYFGLRINEIKGQIDIDEKEGDIPDDQVPKPAKKAKTKKGDLWLLGKHRLLCGDSTNVDDVNRLMDGKKAALFATDPPYCIDYTGKDRPNGGKDWTDSYREIDIPDIVEFMIDFLKVGLTFIKKKTPIFLWHATSQICEIHQVCNNLNLLIHQQIIWVKPCVVLGFSVYSWRHEPCLLIWPKGSNPEFQVKSKSISTVWPVGYVKDGYPTTPEYYTDVWEADWDGKKRPVGFGQPTSKPVEIFAIPMRVHTKPGDICYEPFSGSGSQIIAAEKLGRKCYAMEKEPVFVDVAVERWQQWTGKKAKRL